MMEKGGKLMSFRFAQHCLRCGLIGAKICMNCTQSDSKRSAHVALVFVTYFVNPTIPVFFIVLKTSRVFVFIYKIKFARARRTSRNFREGRGGVKLKMSTENGECVLRFTFR